MRKYIYFIILLASLVVFLFSPTVGIYDWVKEIIYTDFIYTSIHKFQSFPAFLWNASQLSAYPSAVQSAFFLGNPETLVFSPFVFLLFFLKPIPFLKVLIIIHFILGGFGLIAVGKRLEFSKSQRRMLSGIFLFSPIVIQHLAIGYTPWINLFLIPWVIYFCFEEKIFRQVLGLGFLSGTILLQGGLHVFVWVTAFLGIFFLFQTCLRRDWRYGLSLVGVVVSSSIFGLARMWHSLKTFADFSQQSFPGYSLGGFLQWALKLPMLTPSNMDEIEGYIESYINGVPYWDGAVFWGPVLILGLILPVLLFWRRRERKISKNADLPTSSVLISILTSSFVLLVFSFGTLYEKLSAWLSELFGIGFLTGMEKYPFRWALLPYFGFGFLISYYWDDFVKFFQIIQEKLSFAIRKLDRQVSAVDACLSPRRKVVSFALGIIFGLIVLAVLIQKPFLKYLFEAITHSYQTESGILFSLMENSTDIPMVAYHQKAENLYRILLMVTLRTGIILLIIRLISGKAKKISNWVQKVLSNTKKHTALILELSIILPLMVAYFMWFRVAIATPQENMERLAFKPPEHILAGAETQTDLSLEMHVTPNHINIITNIDEVGADIVFPHIPATDLVFLRVMDGSANLIERNGQAAITDIQEGDLVIGVNREAYMPVIWINFAIWLTGLISLAYFETKKKKPSF